MFGRNLERIYAVVIIQLLNTYYIISGYIMTLNLDVSGTMEGRDLQQVILFQDDLVTNLIHGCVYFTSVNVTARCT